MNKNKLKLETKIRALISQIDYLNEQEKSHTNRSIQINRNQNKLRAEVRARLLSEEGVRLA